MISQGLGADANGDRGASKVHDGPYGLPNATLVDKTPATLDGPGEGTGGTRYGRLAAGVIVLAVVLHAGFMIASGGTRLFPRGIGFAYACMALPVAALLTRNPRALHLSLVLALLPGWYVAGGPLLWPLYLLGPLAVYGAIVAAAPSLRASVGFLRKGSLDRGTLALMGAATLVSSTALVGWFYLLHPDVRDELGNLPSVGVPLLLLGGLGFALVNAALEEIIWRGVMYEALASTRAPTWSVIGIQALSFGILHVGGFPRGAIGVAMASIYGVFMGVIRARSGGLLAPFLAHVVADVTIFALILTLLR